MLNNLPLCSQNRKVNGAGGQWKSNAFVTVSVVEVMELVSHKDTPSYDLSLIGTNCLS